LVYLGFTPVPSGTFFSSLSSGPFWMSLEHLMLLSFSDPDLLGWSDEHLEILDESPFDGVASAVTDPYDTGPIPRFEKFERTVDLLKKQRVKFWPWVFLNRMIGRGPGSRAHRGAPAADLFRRIKALDLENETGARDDFLGMWRLALRLARHMGSPGIVADFEAYNDYRAYDPHWVAKRRGEGVDRVVTLLKRLGSDLAQNATEEYPGAVIWQLFFDPYREPYSDGNRRLTRTTNYINLGLLERASKEGLDLKVIDGGETHLGYFNATLVQLESKITSHWELSKPWRERFRGRFALGGTIAPYADASKLTWWIRQAAGEDPVWKGARDFGQVFLRLFRSYSYVWIYAASAADFDPYDRASARSIYDVISSSRARLRKGCS